MHVKTLNSLMWYYLSVFCQEEKARVIQTLLFVAGINTLCQSFFGTRLPAVMGGSYTVVAPTISIIMASRYSNETDPREVAPLLLGVQDRHCHMPRLFFL
jgi:xanthine/uracil permease